MPLSGNTYVAPTWVDKGPPALDAAELQAMCDAIVNNQDNVSSLQSALQSLTTTVNGKPNMQIVSYVGTGTYGSRNPCSITADFPVEYAQIIAFSSNGAVSSPTGTGRFIMISDELTTTFQENTGFAKNTNYDSLGKRSSDKKTISWYTPYSGDKGAQQFNQSGIKYYFVCQGY